MMNLTVRYELRGESRGSVNLVDQQHPKEDQRKGRLGVVVMRKSMFADLGEMPVIDFTIEDGREYVLHTTTKRFVRFARAVLKGQAIRNHPLPYIYMRNDVYAGLGEPYSFALKIAPVMP